MTDSSSTTDPTKPSLGSQDNLLVLQEVEQSVLGKGPAKRLHQAMLRILGRPPPGSACPLCGHRVPMTPAQRQAKRRARKAKLR